MNRLIFLCLCSIIALTLTKVDCHKGGYRGRRPTAMIPTGFRRDNGPCVCNAPKPTAWRRGHMHRPGHHGSRGPRPTGHHGHMGPRPSGHHGHMGPEHRGHHSPRPTGPWHYMSKAASSIRPCVCRKQSERLVQIKFRMKKQWKEQLSDVTSMTFDKYSRCITNKVKKVLKNVKHINNMKFSQGSIIVHFEVVSEVAKDGSNSEDPKTALRNAIQNGELKDLDIYPESLAVKESFSGVKVGEWKTSEKDCRSCRRHGHHRHRHHHHGDHHREHHVVRQTRTCEEIDMSCDGIPLTRNATCEEACAESFMTRCWGGMRRHKTVVLACIIAGVVFVIAIAILLLKVKKSRKKYVKTSPSTESVKELAQHDELQLPVKVMKA